MRRDMIILALITLVASVVWLWSLFKEKMHARPLKVNETVTITGNYQVCSYCRGYRILSIPCDMCGGSGLVTQDCPVCHGDGELYEKVGIIKHSFGESVLYNTTKCCKCNGAGYVTLTCSKCEGTGILSHWCSHCGGKGYIVRSSK